MALKEMGRNQVAIRLDIGDSWPMPTDGEHHRKEIDC